MNPHTLTRCLGATVAVGALCASLAGAAGAEALPPAPSVVAPQAAAHAAGPYLPAYYLRRDAQQYVEQIDVMVTNAHDESYIDSCAKLTRSMGVCTYTTFVDYDDGDSFACHGRVRITLTFRGWIGHEYGYRCGS